MSSLLTVSEVAQQLNCKADLVRSLIARGKLRAVSLSEKRKCYRVRQEWIDDFLIAESESVNRSQQPTRVPVKNIRVSKYFD